MVASPQNMLAIHPVLQIQHNLCMPTSRNGTFSLHPNKSFYFVFWIYQGNLADGQGAGREDPVGAVHSEENSGALVQLEDGTAASLEANKAMCHKALFDILISEKFAMLCDLLAATFHVNKPDDLIGLQIIDAKMRNGDYAQNPALLDHDIKQVPVCLFASFLFFSCAVFSDIEKDVAVVLLESLW
jgi:hypothetical protein